MGEDVDILSSSAGGQGVIHSVPDCLTDYLPTELCS